MCYKQYGVSKMEKCTSAFCVTRQSGTTPRINFAEELARMTNVDEAQS